MPCDAILVLHVKYTCRNHVCGLAVAGADLVASQAYPGMTRSILAFLHLRQPSNEDIEVSIDKIDSNCIH